jgi:hypothetical protein
MRGAPHSSQDRSEGWFKYVHRGHWKLASGSEVGAEAAFCARRSSGVDPKLRVDAGRGRSGSGLLTPEDPPAGALFDAAATAAFKTRCNEGLTPQFRHGGSGVCEFAVNGSKFDGTVLEKLQTGQTHVAALTGPVSTAWCRRGLSAREPGDALLDRGGTAAREGDRLDSEDRFDGLGMSVIFAEAFKNPAWNITRQL